jgi:hypothetical protein
VLFLDKKRLAGYLLGGVLLLGLLIGGYLFWYYETGQDEISRTPQWEIESTMCTGRVGDSFVGGAESVNLSEIESCVPAANYREIRNLPSVEGFNESTFVATCDTSGANTSN